MNTLNLVVLADLFLLSRLSVLLFKRNIDFVTKYTGGHQNGRAFPRKVWVGC